MAQLTAPPEGDPGDVIRAARTERGETQKQLAARAGLSQGYICQLELGDRPLTEGAAVKLERALGFDPYSLVDLVDDDRNGGSQPTVAYPTTLAPVVPLRPHVPAEPVPVAPAA